MSSRFKVTSTRGALLALCLCGAVTSCEDPLLDPATVDGPRILGARVRAEGDPRVAEPRPGERATLEWLAVSNRPEPLSATLAWCVASQTLLGAPRCTGPAFDERVVTGDFGDPVGFELTLPAELLPGDAWLAWFGHCDTGAARFDPQASAFACPEGAAPLSAFYRGFVPGAAPNQNPSLADDVLLLGGAPWPEPVEAALPGEGCSETTLPRLVSGVESFIELERLGDDRELLEEEQTRYAARERESLVYTHVSSRAGLDRAFSAIDFDAAEQRFTLPVTFGAEGDPGPEGEAVFFYLVVRDERGGVDWLRRDACLLSP